MMDGQDQQQAENQNPNTSGGSATDGTAASSVMDAFKNASGGQGKQTPKKDEGGKAPDTTSEKAEQEPETRELKPWGAQLSKELKENKEAVKALSKFEDITGLAASYLELQKKIGSMQSIPGKEASAEELDAFYKKLGKPESADKYSFKQEEEGEKAFAEFAYKNHLSDAQAKAAYDFLMMQAQNGIESQKAQITAMAQQTDAALKKEYGTKTNEKLNAYTKALQRFGSEQAVQDLQNSGIAYSAPFVKMMIQIGEALGESRTVAGGNASGQAGIKSVNDGGSFSFFT